MKSFARGAFSFWFLLCLALVLLAPASGHAALVAVPPMNSRVVDLTGTLDGGQIEQLHEQIATIEEQTQAQVAVLMVDTTGDDAIEQFATRVFDSWKPGTATEDNGLLILVALKDRRMRIEVGQGLEGIVPDVAAGRIVDHQMAPRFKKSDYAGGLEAAIAELGQRLRGEAPRETPSLATGGGAQVTPFGWGLLASVLWSFVVGVWRGRHTVRWQVTASVLMAVPLIAAAVLGEVGMGVMMMFPSLGLFALGLGCGRSAKMRRFMLGAVVVIGLLIAIANGVGAGKFGLGVLILIGIGLGGLLIALVGYGMVTAWKRSLLEFCARWVAVFGITAYVGWSNPPGPELSSWIPVALAAGLSLLFGFFPNDGSGGGSSSGRSSGSSSSSSSGSSSSSSGGSSSGGGASGSW